MFGARRHPQKLIGVFVEIGLVLAVENLALVLFLRDGHVHALAVLDDTQNRPGYVYRRVNRDDAMIAVPVERRTAHVVMAGLDAAYPGPFAFPDAGWSQVGNVAKRSYDWPGWPCNRFVPMFGNDCRHLVGLLVALISR